MKILFITSWYPDEENPVAGIFVQEHAKAVSISGDQVTVIFAKQMKITKKRLYHIFETFEDGIRTIRVYYSPTRFRILNYFIYIFGILKVSSRVICNGFHPDIIHAHIFTSGIPAALLGKLYKIPVVLSEHFSEYAQNKLRVIERIQAKFAISQATVVLCVSEVLKKKIKRFDKKEKFKVIPNVVVPKLFYPINKKEKEENIKKILFVGLLKENKGVHYLLQALAKLKSQRQDWHLDIIGDGPTRKECEKLAIDLKIFKKITFHGLKNKADVASFMRKADLFVFSSFFETFSVVTAEALASGITVLITSCGGPEEFIKEDLGLVVPTKDSESLCKGLNYMLNNLEKYDKYYISNYAYNLFNPEKVGKELKKIYSECIKKYNG